MFKEHKQLLYEPVREKNYLMFNLTSMECMYIPY